MCFSGYRESAYLWAMSAAGAAWGVATACASGWLPECKCVSPKNTHYYTQQRRRSLDIDASNEGVEITPEWEWSGCSYGVQYGVVMSRRLLTRSNNDASNVKTELHLGKLERHNLKAGRLVSVSLSIFFLSPKVLKREFSGS